MTGLIGRLQRRAEGGGAAMLPYIAERPADPRFGPTSPLAEFAGEPVVDPFAESVPLVEPPSVTAERPAFAALPASVTTPRPAFATASAAAPVRTERIVERTHPIAEAHPVVVAAPASPPVEPVPRDSTAVVAPPVPELTSARTIQQSERTPARGATTTTAITAPPAEYVPRDTSDAPPLAAPSRLVQRSLAEARPGVQPSAPLPAGTLEGRSEVRLPARPEGRSEVRLPARLEPLAPRAAANPVEHSVPRLEPRPRDPAPPSEAAPESAGPRVVIGNLHIEVVRSPAPAAPRREPARREAPRAAAPAAAKPTTRRRTIFGLGQL
ncbi:hypothetical protein [Nannocystis radixulma]|uniref:Uncharacterized protein n=1 Tax=Nannocystis radixulma TaxID=2995305 RepID=A0ABT5BFE3_9BACT|nr:hypothetical protein [Nannocystis radixulma]MDC0672864.1 hypothetical protein [Nannocystis radixulma]